MSSETTTLVIPKDTEVQATGLGGAWRFAGGKIRKGRQGAFEDRPNSDGSTTNQKVVGILRRVGVHSGQRKSDNVAFSQVEADIETANGIEHFKSSLTDDEGRLRPSSATVGFAWGLLQVGLDAQIMLTVAEAEFTTEKGGKPTFVNVWTSKNSDWKFSQCVRPKRADGPKVELVDQWKALEADFLKHPAFAERSMREDDDDEGNPANHFSALCNECEAKGWPTPEQATPEWLSLMAAYYDHPQKGRLGEYSDDEWGQIRLDLKDQTQAPKLLAPAIERMKALATTATTRSALL